MELIALSCSEMTRYDSRFLGVPERPRGDLDRVEKIAVALLDLHPAVTPHLLAVQAKIDWDLARRVLQELVKNGRATALKSGQFGAPKAVLPRGDPER